MENLDDALRLAAEMRAGLDGVTEGPWIAHPHEQYSCFHVCSTPDWIVSLVTFATDVDLDKGHSRRRALEHIARCHPSNIRLLLDTIDTLRRERDERADAVEAQAKCNAAQIAQAETTIAAQAAEIEGLKAAKEDMRIRLATAFRVKDECNEDANRERHQRIRFESTVERLKADIARKDAALEKCEEYFDQRADGDPAGFVPNKEMSLLATVRDALSHRKQEAPVHPECGWLVELRGSTPSWAVLNPNDYDEHWTADSAKAIRFARQQDAQTFIQHNGWTEAFPSEHIWVDGARAALYTGGDETAREGGR